jgi:putative oxidoreductase
METTIKMASTDTGRRSLALLLLRWVPGLIFFSEGIQKFLFSDLGAGRFAKIGFAHPAFWADLMGGFEIICGLLLVVGLLTRWATVPLLVVIAVASATTKWPELMNKGFWVFAHDYRTDFAMTLTLLAVLLLGTGHWSLDAKRGRG